MLHDQKKISKNFRKTLDKSALLVYNKITETPKGRKAECVMKNEIELIPTYWASVSGGKDSLYMLKLILQHPERYPLDGVIHFELEIDYPFIKNVIDYMESECKKHGVKFVRIKPTKTWEEHYNTVNAKTGSIYGFPTRKARWCNSHYKLDAKRQMDEYMRSIGRKTIYYIGYCADEEKRMNRTTKSAEIYPLADFGIEENLILEWARNTPIFNNFYKTNRRCGCMFCPMASKMNLAYLYKYYPEQFAYMMEKVRETEQIRERELGRPFAVLATNPKYNADYMENIIKNKWLYKLNEEENKLIE